jgi:HSP20 family molecular chaperone IbpA
MTVVTSNQVTLSGQHDEQQEDHKRRYSEKATFENGILKITLQPTSPIAAKKIPIEAT